MARARVKKDTREVLEINFGDPEREQHLASLELVVGPEEEEVEIDISPEESLNIAGPGESIYLLSGELVSGPPAQPPPPPEPNVYRIVLEQRKQKGQKADSPPTLQELIDASDEKERRVARREGRTPR